MELCRFERKTASVTVRMVWQREVEAGIEVGCCFIRKGSYELIQRSELTLQGDVPDQLSPVTADSLNLSGIWWVGLIAISALAVLNALGTFGTLFFRLCCLFSN